MKFDPLWLSTLWGRIGATIMGFAAMILGFMNIDFSIEDQSNAVAIVTAILGGLAGLWSLISKLREQARLRAQPIE